MGVIMSYIGLGVVAFLLALLVFIIVIFYKLETLHQTERFKNDSVTYKKIKRNDV
jgi:Na+-transporting methylmalonyl-CoA/oxaloacetate decarboxylase gamma subunit